MSKYTTEVRYICENASGLTASVGLSDVDTVIANSYASIFDTTWDIYDEDYREVLCCKILKHYYVNEIGAETVGLWKFWLNERMSIIMPYYNQLYKSILYIDSFPNPFYDIDYYDEYSGEGTKDSTDVNKTTGTATGTSTSDTENSDSSTDWNMYSDTPQGSLTGVSSNKYLTNATEMTHEGEAEASNTTSITTSNTVNENKTGNINTTDTYLKHIYGKANSSKSYWNILKEIRENILNVDMMIIEELQDLFITLW